jgi:hypothetical protein
MANSRAAEADAAAREAGHELMIRDANLQQSARCIKSG